MHAAGIGLLVGRQVGLEKQAGEAENAVQRRAKLVADGCEEARLGLVRRLRLLAGLDQRLLDLLARSDVARDRINWPEGAGIVAHADVDPGVPARALDGVETQVARLDVAGFMGFAGRRFLDRLQRQRAAEHLAERMAEGAGEGGVDEGDAAVAIAVDDEIALGIDQAAIALLAFAQLPGGIGKRFDLALEAAILLRDPVELAARLGIVDARGAPQAGGAEKDGDRPHDRRDLGVDKGEGEGEQADEAGNDSEGGGRDAARHRPCWRRFTRFGARPRDDRFGRGLFWSGGGSLHRHIRTRQPSGHGCRPSQCQDMLSKSLTGRRAPARRHPQAATASRSPATR